MPGLDPRKLFGAVLLVIVLVVVVLVAGGVGFHLQQTSIESDGCTLTLPYMWWVPGSMPKGKLYIPASYTKAKTEAMLAKIDEGFGLTIEKQSSWRYGEKLVRRVKAVVISGAAYQTVSGMEVDFEGSLDAFDTTFAADAKYPLLVKDIGAYVKGLMDSGEPFSLTTVFDAAEVSFINLYSDIPAHLDGADGVDGAVPPPVTTPPVTTTPVTTPPATLQQAVQDVMTAYLTNPFTRTSNPSSSVWPGTSVTTTEPVVTAPIISEPAVVDPITPEPAVDPRQEDYNTLNAGIVNLFGDSPLRLADAPAVVTVDDAAIADPIVAQVNPHQAELDTVNAVISSNSFLGSLLR